MKKCKITWTSTSFYLFTLYEPKAGQHRFPIIEDYTLNIRKVYFRYLKLIYEK